MSLELRGRNTRLEARSELDALRARLGAFKEFRDGAPNLNAAISRMEMEVAAIKRAMGSPSSSLEGADEEAAGGGESGGRG